MTSPLAPHTTPRPSPVTVIAVSRRGATLASALAQRLPRAVARVPRRFASGLDGAEGYDGPVGALIASIWGMAGGLVLVMPAGAAVRLVAPYLRDKFSDPAVVVVDDAGLFAIALLGGHAGGANDLARQVAQIVAGQAIITTAAESAGVPSADLIGHSFGWRIENPSQLTPLAAALVNADPVGLVQELGERHWFDRPLPPWVTAYRDVEALRAAAPTAAIIISDRRLPEMIDRPGWVVYRPKTLALGIGCSRGATAEEIGVLVDGVLTDAGLSPLSVRAVATIDRKGDEPGLVAFATGRGLPLCIYTAVELDGTPGQETPSPVVRAAVGTRGVCEPAALRCAGATRLLVPKRKSRMATVAVARYHSTDWE